MKIIRSDLGSGHSALPFILYYKIPNIKKNLSAQLLKLEIEYKRTLSYQENRKLQLAREISARNERFLKLENKIERIVSRAHDVVALHHKCRHATLIRSTDRFVINRMFLRARKVAAVA